MKRSGFASYQSFLRQLRQPILRALSRSLGEDLAWEAETLVELCDGKLESLVNLVEDAGCLCDEVDRTNLAGLLRAASRVQPLHECSRLETILRIQARTSSSRTGSSTDSLDLVRSSRNLWRFTPRQDTTNEVTNMRDVEKNLVGKWTDRLCSLILPYKSQLPAIAELNETPNFGQELRDLFGNSRWGTIQSACRSFERYSKFLHNKPALPFSHEAVRGYLNHLRDSDAKPSMIRNFFGGACFLSKVCGIEDITKCGPLQQKKSAVLEQVHTLSYSNSGQAYALPRQVLLLLFDRSKNISLFADRFLIRHCLFLVCSVARYSDGQHISPSRLRKKNDGIAAEAWATKVSGLGKSRGVLPFWAPDKPFGIEDNDIWGSYMNDHKSLGFLERDFLLPKPNSSRTGFSMRPCPNSTALRWLRSVLLEVGVEEDTALKITLASFRVTVPDLAYQGGVPSSVRVFLGRWTSESMADRYTREHLQACKSVWRVINPLFHSDQSFGGKPNQFPTALGGFDTGLDPITDDLFMDTSCQNKQGAQQLVSVNSRDEHWDPLLAAKYLDLQQNNHDEDERIPLAGNRASNKIHICSRSPGSRLWDITAGCKWQFKHHNVELFPPEVFITTEWSLCKPCFRPFLVSMGVFACGSDLSDASMSDLSSVGSSDSDADIADNIPEVQPV